MNWDAIGAIAKLTITGMQASIVDMLIADPALNDLFMRGVASTDDLTDEEYQRFSNLCLKTFWFFSAAHYQLCTGMLDDDNWFETKAVLEFELSGAGVRSWWRRLGSKRFSGKFAEFIDSEIRSIENRGET